MQELRLVLIIVGALAIAALLLHGLWSSRKEKPAKFSEKPLGKLDESSKTADTDGFGDDGVGSVRVVCNDEPSQENIRTARKEPELHFGDKIQADPLMDSATSALNADPALDLPKMSAQQEKAVPPVEPQGAEPISEQAVSPAMHALQSQIHQPKQTETKQASVESELPQPMLKNPEKVTVVEPKMPQPAEPEVQAEPEPTLEPEPQLPPDYLVLNIHARNGEILTGAKLFNCLEKNNMYFGENSVYHRHADSAGTGPTLFSITNMVHPAHFPEGGDESFETPGIAFYLMLPCHGRADYNFNMMLQTVQRVADELSADVLDHERAMITPRRIDEYREKAKLYTRA
ncbi:cell division protein ZipA [uncultured Photobacterium sp.]|uniref:cell division protein ZipA n=1 Tax=uncultured Photobacterium sp. TaxID=173973 RepID=UPI00262A32D6|nr:cell division protein ZipA [uncultured Photobacterium sp.]